MKRALIICILISSISSFAISRPGSSNKFKVTTSIEPTPLKNKLSKKDFINLKIKDFENYTGKKLTLKEKIAFKIAQHNLKKELETGKKPASNNNGRIALILSIIGLALIFVPYLILASIPLAILAIVIGNKAKKINPSDKKARTAVVLGWVTLGLLFAILIIALIVITFDTWFGF